MAVPAQIPVIQTLVNFIILMGHVFLIQVSIRPRIKKKESFGWLMLCASVCQALYFFAVVFLGAFYDVATNQVVFRLLERPSLENLQNLPADLLSADDGVKQWGRALCTLALSLAVCSLPFQTSAIALRARNVLSARWWLLCVISVIIAAISGLCQCVLLIAKSSKIISPVEGRITIHAIDLVLLLMILGADFVFLHTAYRKKKEEEKYREHLESQFPDVEAGCCRPASALIMKPNGCSQAICPDDAYNSKKVFHWKEDDVSSKGQSTTTIVPKRVKAVSKWSGFVKRSACSNLPVLPVMIALICHAGYFTYYMMDSYCFLPTSKDLLPERCASGAEDVIGSFEILGLIQAYLTLKANDTIKDMPRTATTNRRR